MVAHKKRNFLRSVCIAVILALPFSALAAMENDPSDSPSAMPSMELDRYVLQAGPIPIGKALKNISGLTYNPLSETLFMVSNRPTQIIEIDFRGTVKRVIALHGFHDTEGITHLRGNMFAVVEEKRRTICIIIIPLDATTVERVDSKAVIHTEQGCGGNKGLEGIAYDRERGRLYVVKEKSPRILYQINWPTSLEEPVQVSQPWDIQKSGLLLSDLSGVYFRPDTETLLLLSDESAAVVEITKDGREMSRLSLQKGGDSGLVQDIPQAEGITMDAGGRLFISSEPNLLYLFNRPIE